MEDHRRWHLQLLERIRGCLQVASREVQINGRVREVSVPEQELNRAQVRTSFQQMRRIRVAERILTLPMNRPQPSFTTGIIRFTANT